MPELVLVPFNQNKLLKLKNSMRMCDTFTRGGGGAQLTLRQKSDNLMEQKLKENFAKMDNIFFRKTSKFAKILRKFVHFCEFRSMKILLETL